LKINPSANTFSFCSIVFNLIDYLKNICCITNAPITINRLNATMTPVT
jgi:hypothetical protein